MILAVSRRIQAANKGMKGLGEEKDSSKTRLKTSMVKKKASREMKWNKKRKKKKKEIKNKWKKWKRIRKGLFIFEDEP